MLGALRRSGRPGPVLPHVGASQMRSHDDGLGEVKSAVALRTFAEVSNSGLLQLIPKKVTHDPDSNPKALEMWRPLQIFVLDRGSTERITEVVLLLDWAVRLFQRRLSCTFEV